MDYEIHLRPIAFDGKPCSLEHLLTYAEAAERLDIQVLAANDHLVFSRPWLAGLTTLAAVLAQAGTKT